MKHTDEKEVYKASVPYLPTALARRASLIEAGLLSGGRPSRLLLRVIRNEVRLRMWAL